MTNISRKFMPGLGGGETGSPPNIVEIENNILKRLVTASVNPGTISTTDVGFDGVILAGQSNMSGHTGGGFDSAIDYTDPRLLQWIAGNPGYIALASETLNFPDRNGRAGEISLGMSFGKWLLSTMPLNRRLVLIPAASGGTGFSDNRWNPGNDLYNAMVAMAQQFLANNSKNKITALLWHQGENDAGNLSKVQYAARLDAMITALRTALNLPNLPVVVGQLAQGWVGTDAGRLAIQNALTETPSRVSKTAVAVSTGLSANGTIIHFAPQSQRLFGKIYFEALQTILNAVTVVAPTIAPTALNTSNITANSVTASWTSNETQFDLDYKLSSGSTWTTVSSVSNPYTLTGLTNNSTYNIRVRSKNSAGNSPYSSVSTFSTTNVVVTPPSAPTTLISSNIQQTAITVGWTSSATNFDLDYKVSSGSTWETINNATNPQTVSGLTANTSYDFRVRAKNAGGSSANSTVLTATTQSAIVIPQPRFFVNVVNGNVIDTSGNNLTVTPVGNPPPTVISDTSASARGQVMSVTPDRSYSLASGINATYSKEIALMLTASVSNQNFISSDATPNHVWWAPSANTIQFGHGSSLNMGNAQNVVLALNTWYHMVMTYDPTTATILQYINGTLVQTVTSVAAFAGAASPALVRIGSYSSGVGMQGVIDFAALYNAVLTQSQVTELYNRYVAKQY